MQANLDNNPAAGPTVRKLVLDFLAMRAIDRNAGLIGDAFFLRLNYMLGDFCALYGSEPASALRPSHVRGWILSHERWKSASMREHAARAVKSLFSWADEEEMIDKDRIRKMRPCWDTPQPRGAIRPEEYVAIMRAARHYQSRNGSRRRAGRALRLALFFMHETGARTCEARLADWSQVNWQAGLLVMPSKTSRKTGRKRQIPLGAVLLRLLRWMHRRAGYPQSGTIFLSGRGKPWDRPWLARLFAKIARAAGVHRPGLSPYCLRHAFAVAGLEAGIGERQLADVLGHTTTRFVAWYGKDARGNADYLRGVADELRRHRDQQGGGA